MGGHRFRVERGAGRMEALAESKSRYLSSLAAITGLLMNVQIQQNFITSSMQPLTQIPLPITRYLYSSFFSSHLCLLACGVGPRCGVCGSQTFVLALLSVLQAP